MCTHLKYHLHTCICEFKIFEIFRIFKICCAHTSTIIFTPAFLDLKYLKCLKYLKYFLHTTHLKYHLHTCIANMKVRPSTINIWVDLSQANNASIWLYAWYRMREDWCQTDWHTFLFTSAWLSHLRSIHTSYPATLIDQGQHGLDLCIITNRTMLGKF